MASRQQTTRPEGLSASLLRLQVQPSQQGRLLLRDRLDPIQHLVHWGRLWSRARQLQMLGRRVMRAQMYQRNLQ
jgi:hypothetical protein